MVNERQGDGPPEDVKWLRPRFRLSDCFTLVPPSAMTALTKGLFVRANREQLLRRVE